MRKYYAAGAYPALAKNVKVRYCTQYVKETFQNIASYIKICGELKSTFRFTYLSCK